MKQSILHFFISLLCLNFVWAAPLLAVGSGGFENASFSAWSLGQSNAVAAQSEEPAGISYNPAGITDLPGVQVQSNLSTISIFTFYNGEKDNIQSNTRSSGTVVPVPTGYITLNPGELLGGRVAIGVGSDSPFGLLNKYNSGHGIVRYAGFKNWLKMYTIKPVLAVKLLDWLSIGAGPIYYKVYDFGGMQAYPNKLIVAGLPDGQVRLNLSGNRWGWHMGVLAKPHAQHRFGFYFRSPVVIRTRGLAKVENSSFHPNTHFETGAQSKLGLPLNFTFAYAFSPTERTTLEADVGFTRWSIVNKIFIPSDPVGGFDDTIMAAIGASGGNEADYGNGFSLHLGANHQLTDRLRVLFGFLYYSSVIPKDHWRPWIPDSARLGLSTGVSIDVTKNLILDLIYLQMFNLRRTIANDIGSAVGTTVDGDYFSSFQEGAVSFRYKWEQPLKAFGVSNGETPSSIEV